MSRIKVVLITGASRGIGRAIAKRFASKDTDLVVTHSGSDLSVMSGLGDELTPLCHTFEAQRFSVSDAKMAAEAVSEIIKTYGRLDVLVNNAGITRDGLCVRMGDEDFSEVIDVNLKGAFNLCRAAARPMMKQRYGRIINVSSVVAF
ncbi:MAG: SDR family NAD(P)-dependent oxidoreductase, partial [Deltaproteobacteria bacterium]|nr:SDR family NAD(P)-dependent oxidoreductase [Deltaproteobacteria bacterium]